MNGPDEMMRNNSNAGSDAFERELSTALHHLNPPPDFAARLMKRVSRDEAARKEPASSTRVLTMPRRRAWPQVRGWTAGALAATVVAGVLVGEHVHQRRAQERAQAAEQQFDTAMRVTDQALAKTKDQLMRAGVSLSD